MFLVVTALGGVEGVTGISWVEAMEANRAGRSPSRGLSRPGVPCAEVQKPCSRPSHTSALLGLQAPAPTPPPQRGPPAPSERGASCHPVVTWHGFASGPYPWSKPPRCFPFPFCPSALLGHPGGFSSRCRGKFSCPATCPRPPATATGGSRGVAHWRFARSPPASGPLSRPGPLRGGERCQGPGPVGRTLAPHSSAGTSQSCRGPRLGGSCGARRPHRGGGGGERRLFSLNALHPPGVSSWSGRAALEPADAGTQVPAQTYACSCFRVRAQS